MLIVPGHIMPTAKPQSAQPTRPRIGIGDKDVKGTVNIYHGAGEKDINYIMDDNYLDPISGFPGFKSYCCRLQKKER